MTHRVGIIGLGTVGARFVEQFALHPAFDLVAAWDPDDGACEAASATVRTVDSAAKVIDAADVVYIAVPPLYHREYVEACLAAAKAIFCEKPLGIDLAESRSLVDLVEQSGLPAGVNFVFGGAPSALGLQRAIAAGDIGNIVRGDLRLHFGQWPRAWHSKAQWLRLRDQGGWIREVVSHFLFLAGRVLGPLELSAADVVFPDGPTGDFSECEATARLISGHGPLVMIGTSEGVGPDVVDFTVRGDRASLRILDWYRLQTSDGDEWSDLLGDDRGALGGEAYRSQLDQLALLLDDKPNSIASFGEALAVQELVESILGQATATS